MQDVEFAVVALAGDPAEPLELVPAQRVKPLVTCSVLQQTDCRSVLQNYDADHRLDGKGQTTSASKTEFVKFTSIPLGPQFGFKSSQRVGWFTDPIFILRFGIL